MTIYDYIVIYIYIHTYIYIYMYVSYYTLNRMRSGGGPALALKEILCPSQVAAASAGFWGFCRLGGLKESIQGSSKGSIGSGV